jgi:hypothetical protein
MRRVTDTSIPEDEAFRAVEKIIVPMWTRATKNGERRFWHEYFYELIQRVGPQAARRATRHECWLLAAAKAKPAHRGAGPRGLHLRQHLRLAREDRRVQRLHREVGHRVHGRFYDDYRKLSKGAGVGFFQIGGGIAGDFPICVVPSIKYDLQEPVKPWAYFCQISDSTTSYGSYSGATPNEKITWDKLTEDTPMFVIESDATIVAPLMLRRCWSARVAQWVGVPTAAGEQVDMVGHENVITDPPSVSFRRAGPDPAQDLVHSWLVKNPAPLKGHRGEIDDRCVGEGPYVCEVLIGGTLHKAYPGEFRAMCQLPGDGSPPSRLNGARAPRLH